MTTILRVFFFNVEFHSVLDVSAIHELIEKASLIISNIIWQATNLANLSHCIFKFSPGTFLEYLYYEPVIY